MITFIWPITGPISRDFYYKSSIYIGGQHGAVDIPASSGTPIKVAASGLVTKTSYNDISGHYLEVAHNEGWVTNYRHMVEQASVDVGVSVSQGQIIGKVGSTGWSTGPHLHFDLWNSIKQSPEAMYKGNIWAHDPELYLGQEDEMNQADFNKMFKTAVAEYGVLAVDDAGNEVGARHTIALYLYRIRQLQTQVRRLEQGSAAYTNEQAVKAVKDKLS
ncbi:hypothetical protein LCGC14_1700440 [marine sediment metagenome]|uniref:M23ase beta-sheet core domain-containing protein n=1 Tax=marine sediment metagenome TaxID=412755 RepID=A0A0F9I5U0_9ZZZZ